MPPQRVCGNPLFRDWIEQERINAQEKGLKSAETFGRAWKSLAACPVTYSHPRELVCLQYVGPKIVDILVRKWRIHCDENGIALEPTPQKRRPKARSPSPSIEIGPDVAARANKKRAPAKPKSYIPQPRSGAYAILLGLLLAIDEPTRNTTVYLTKTELIQSAQPYCDASFTHSEKGAFYTAWSSAKTLIGKGYVYVTGNPHKYCLTEEGYEVACAIRALHPEFGHIEKHPFLHEPVDTPMAGPLRPRQVSPRTASSRPPLTAPGYASSSHTNHGRKRPSPEAGSSGGSSSGRFRFSYIDSIGDRVDNLSSATIRLDPEEFVNLRKIEFRQDQHSHPFVRQLKLVDSQPQTRDGSGQATYYGYILEDGAPPMCSKLDDGLNTAKRRRLSRDDEDSDVEIVPAAGHNHRPHLTSGHDPSTFARTHSTATTLPSRPSSSMAQLAAEASACRTGPADSFIATSSLTDLNQIGAPKPPRAVPRLSSHIPIHNPLLDKLSHPLSARPDEPLNLPTWTPSQAITFPAGSYEIILVIDTREIESRSSRDKITDALTAKGVKVETRALRLGDMCWVARKLDGMGGEEDECVLDYVVERKRLDDLCSSIKDGRYTEQCFRLGNSGINHVYYIVEDFQVAERMEYNGLQIMTAKSQIQVHNRFFLKETHKLSETIDFLRTMTGVIRALHAHADLKVIPTKYLSRSSYKAFQAHLKAQYPHQTFLTSFEAYQTLNDKSASQTLKEKFARMLLAVKGMSAERVSAVLDVWETPRGLWEDLKIHEAEDTRGADTGRGVAGAEVAPGSKKKKEKERGKDMFFADRVKGEGRRKIGDALSRELYRTLMTATPGVDD